MMHARAENTAGPSTPPPPDAPMLEHALDYARRGWPVFPCRADNKALFFDGGFHKATTDEKTIRGWWKYWPEAMIGVPMGSASGVWAVDPDPPDEKNPSDGREVWANLIEQHGPHHATHTEISPRGGNHIVFKWDSSRPVTNSPGGLAKTNVDVRGEGGYIVVAPSICVGDGGSKNVAGQYRVAGNFFCFADAPDWLYELVLTKPTKSDTTQPRLKLEATAEPQPSPDVDGKKFWRAVNDTAFHNLAAWVPALFGSAAVFQPGTGAWRISSKALGRDLEEDLSIHPSGVTDFGIHDMGDGRQGKRTAIDLVIEHGNAPDATPALVGQPLVCSSVRVAHKRKQISKANNSKGRKGSNCSGTVSVTIATRAHG